MEMVLGRDSPPDTNCESSILPVPPFMVRKWLLAVQIRAWSTVDFVRVAVAAKVVAATV